ncbi:MAG TPA: uroporphyrinogen-III synthase [Anaerolineales bacterium]|nr:uroporphyrinogen-III synthase [Anaerolineales bacterium]
MPELNGKMVVVTRPRENFPAFASLLEAQGASPIPFPTIEIRPTKETQFLQSSLKKLPSFDWLILTSANAVKVLSNHITSDSMAPSLKLAAVGSKTADAMLQLAWRVDFIPEKYAAKAILPGLGTLAGQRVLLARGDLASPDLPAGIRASGGQVTDLEVYRTVPAYPAVEGLRQIRLGVDTLTFTSSSTVHNFVSMMHKANLDPGNLPGSPVYAYIGPVTAGTARDCELPIDIVADIHTLEGMVDSLCRFYAEKKAGTK